MGKPKLVAIKPDEAPDVEGLLKALGDEIKEHQISQLLFIGKTKNGSITFLFNGENWTELELQGTLVMVGQEITRIYGEG